MYSNIHNGAQKITQWCTKTHNNTYIHTRTQKYRTMSHIHTMTYSNARTMTQNTHTHKNSHFQKLTDFCRLRHALKLFFRFILFKIKRFSFTIRFPYFSIKWHLHYLLIHHKIITQEQTVSFSIQNTFFFIRITESV